MSIQQITTLLDFCLTNTYFLFQGKYYEQVQGAAMGSPINPLITNLFVEDFEVKALSTCQHPPSLWLRFVDDTFVITKAEYSQELLHHINSQDPYIQFTVEPTQQGSLPFLDTVVTIGDTRSKEINLPFSVPQGSCAGPVLYSAYASTTRGDK